MQDNTINTVILFTSETITGSGSITSAPIDMNAYKPNGECSLDVNMTGDGQVRGEYLISLDDVTYLQPYGVSGIFTGLTSGREIYAFTPKVGTKMKIRLHEVLSSGAITSVILALR